jgi:uncharacterized protein with PIN domain
MRGVRCPKCNSIYISGPKPERELKVGAITLPGGNRYRCNTCKYGWLTDKDGKVIA